MNRSLVYPLAAGLERLLAAAEDAAAVIAVSARHCLTADLQEAGAELRAALDGLGVRPAGKSYEEKVKEAVERALREAGVPRQALEHLRVTTIGLANEKTLTIEVPCDSKSNEWAAYLSVFSAPLRHPETAGRTDQ